MTPGSQLTVSRRRHWKWRWCMCTVNWYGKDRSDLNQSSVIKSLKQAVTWTWNFLLNKNAYKSVYSRHKETPACLTSLKVGQTYPVSLPKRDWGLKRECIFHNLPDAWPPLPPTYHYFMCSILKRLPWAFLDKEAFLRSSNAFKKEVWHLGAIINS